MVGGGYMSATKSTDKVEPFWLNKSQMAESAGLTVQCFDRWGVQPTAKVGRSVYFRVSDVIKNRVERALDKQHPKAIAMDQLEPNQITYEKYRLTKAQADAQELKNELASGEVIPTDFATFALSKINSEAVGILNSLPMRMQRMHPEITHNQRENIERELAKACNVIAKLDDMLPRILEEYKVEMAEK